MVKRNLKNLFNHNGHCNLSTTLCIPHNNRMPILYPTHHPHLKQHIFSQPILNMNFHTQALFTIRAGIYTLTTTLNSRYQKLCEDL